MLSLFSHPGGVPTHSSHSPTLKVISSHWTLVNGVCWFCDGKSPGKKSYVTEQTHHPVIRKGAFSASSPPRGLCTSLPCASEAVAAGYIAQTLYRITHEWEEWCVIESFTRDRCCAEEMHVVACIRLDGCGTGARIHEFSVEYSSFQCSGICGECFSFLDYT